MDVFNTVNTKKNIFYSAYLTNKVQFNDVDPDKLKEIANTPLLNNDHNDESRESEVRSSATTV